MKQLLESVQDKPVPHFAAYGTPEEKKTEHSSSSEATQSRGKKNENSSSSQAIQSQGKKNPNSSSSEASQSQQQHPPKKLEKKKDEDFLPGVEVPMKASELFPTYWETFYQLEPDKQRDFSRMLDSLKGITNDVVLGSVFFAYPFIQRMVDYRDADNLYRKYQLDLEHAKQIYNEEKKKEAEETIQATFRLIDNYKLTTQNTGSSNKLPIAAASEAPSASSQFKLQSSAAEPMDAFLTDAERIENDQRARQVAYDEQVAREMVQADLSVSGHRGLRRSHSHSIEQIMSENKTAQLIELKEVAAKKQKISGFDSQSYLDASAGTSQLQTASFNPSDMLNATHVSDKNFKSPGISTLPKSPFSLDSTRSTFQQQVSQVDSGVTRLKIDIATCKSFLAQTFDAGVAKQLHKFVRIFRLFVVLYFYIFQ